MIAAFRSRLTGRFLKANLWALSIVLGTAAAVPAGEEQPARRTAGPRRPVSIHGIQWHASVPEALKAASGKAVSAKAAPASPSDSRDKPVLCLRVLGNLSGYM